MPILETEAAVQTAEPPYLDPIDPRFVNEAWLLHNLAEQDVIAGEPDTTEPGLTPEIFKQRMGVALLALGIDPENLRYEQKYEGE